jgi:hypothetical protein
VVGPPADLGDELDAGRTGADDAYVFVVEVDVFVRPPSRVVQLALEVVQSVEVGLKRFRERADRSNEKARLDALTVCGCDRPCP